ncbi:MAG: Mrp/NBP35 family ATP-binding protein [Cytophagales bacterium]|nr:Mrp/NBP35 family ATP-binding protein [Cytophagales bacterium]
MTYLKEKVIEALKTVEDPDLKKDLITLGMVKELQVDEQGVRFTLELTTPACPLKEMIKQACREAIHQQVAQNLPVSIEVTARVTSTRLNAPILPHVKNIIAIASGKGGVGKSTIAANMAIALAKSGANVGLIDADIFGPSIPTMFNCEHKKPQVTQRAGKNHIVPIEQYGVKLLSIGFLAPAEKAVVWRGPMASSALRQFLREAAWGDLDYLMIDLPPGTSDIHLTLVQTVPVTGAVIVSTPQKVALADAMRGLAMFKQPQINVPVLGIIENMAYFSPEELPNNQYYIFGKEGGKTLAEQQKVAFLGQIPLVQGIRESGDAGYPVVMKNNKVAQALKEVAKSLAQQVAIRNAMLDKTKKVEVKT